MIPRYHRCAVFPYLHHGEAVTDISRGLSEATPPVHIALDPHPEEGWQKPNPLTIPALDGHVSGVLPGCNLITPSSGGMSLRSPPG